jgi:hypothetical protein
MDPLTLRQLLALIFLAYGGMFAFAGLTGADECPPGQGYPPGEVPTGTLRMGSVVRILTNSSEPPKFDSNGKVAGRLEVKWPIEVHFFMGVGISEEWTAINEYGDGWGANEAHVACGMLGNELGYEVISSEALSRHDTPDRDYERVYVSDVSCDGDEETLFQCPEWTPHPNTHVYDEMNNIGVACTFRQIRDDNVCEACEPGKAQEVSTPPSSPLPRPLSLRNYQRI